MILDMGKFKVIDMFVIHSSFQFILVTTVVYTVIFLKKTRKAGSNRKMVTYRNNELHQHINFIMTVTAFNARPRANNISFCFIKIESGFLMLEYNVVKFHRLLKGSSPICMESCTSF